MGPAVFLGFFGWTTIAMIDSLLLAGGRSPSTTRPLTHDASHPDDTTRPLLSRSHYKLKQPALTTTGSHLATKHPRWHLCSDSRSVPSLPLWTRHRSIPPCTKPPWWHPRWHPSAIGVRQRCAMLWVLEPKKPWYFGRCYCCCRRCWCSVGAILASAGPIDCC